MSEVAGERSVALVTLGCARNDVDSEELAGRLAAAGWTLVDDPAMADVAVVNTCGFVEQAKKDSIDVLLEAADLREDSQARTKAVVAVGCLAERYGSELAASLPEADAVLGFDSYADMAGQLTSILQGERPASHAPRDRRELLPVSPVARPAVPVAQPGHGDAPATVTLSQATGPIPLSGPPVLRHRLSHEVWAPLKIASGCDRRCAFCAIPRFRGSFVSRPVADVVTEARWLAENGVRELFLVSENSTSYGKDRGDIRALESMLRQLSAVDGIERVRVSYLQPAEVRPSLIDVLTSTPKVVPYFDLSFQHSAAAVLRRMRRFGDTDSFLELIETIRTRSPLAGIRSNVIVGFPGETQAELEELEGFLSQARLDVVGVFGYSDEDETEALELPDKVAPEEVAERLGRVSALVDELIAQRAEDRIGEQVAVLIEQAEDDGELVGRAEHQGPETDGVTRLEAGSAEVGEIVTAVVEAADGADLWAVRA